MKRARLLLLGLSLTTLAGCGNSSDFSDLQAFMAEVQARPRGTIEPLPVFQPYEAFTYSASAMRSPFQPPVKVSLEDRQKGSRDIRPDDSRVREFLEGYSIDEFAMVGTLANQGSTFALLRAGGGVHRIGLGNYLGRNHGRVTAIEPGQIEVVEIVPDGDGGWLERPRTLSLIERS
ncbi:pilus assembly protein PilP [Stutzerimonas tarimensis]|uniref:Pilus assembly protein PilP n=1 Tax=Stutzerimonas tarimensis TaxID=1507735 RepID=A0ABV7T638_9GAMM